VDLLVLLVGLAALVGEMELELAPLVEVMESELKVLLVVLAVLGQVFYEELLLVQVLIRQQNLLQVFF
jgi:hypothetical protein